jgi:type II secretory pathway pseudopilin PulG
VIVVAIMVIILSIATLKFTGAKRATNFRVAASAAISYADAVEAYMADNGQVPPAIGGPGWPAGSRDDRIRGPVNAMLVEGGRPKPYMKGVPEPVGDGVVDMGTSRGSAAPDSRAYVTYTVTGNEYRFLVETIPVDSGDPVLRCVVSNAAATPAGVDRCE